MSFDSADSTDLPKIDTRSVFPGVARADHAPFGAFGLELVYGLTADGREVHISEVQSGLRCGCVCPACGARLVAKKGPQQQHHFAHYGSGVGCGRGRETNVHIWAKQVLERERRIMVPAVFGQVGSRKHQTRPARIITFDEARLEKRRGDIVPDVVLVVNGKELIVEVRVTHACDEEKIGKIRRDGVPAIEVDLSGLRHVTDRAKIEQALITLPARDWLFSRLVDRAQANLEAQIEAERKARAVALKSEAQELLAAAREAVNAECPEISGVVRFVATYECGSMAGIDVEGARGFLAPTGLWQAAIIARALLPAMQDSYAFGRWLTVDNAFKSIRDCIHPAFHQPIGPSLAAVLKAMAPGAIFPREAIQAFLERLRRDGKLRDDGIGGYAFPDGLVQRVGDLHHSFRLQNERRVSVKDRIETILDRLPEAEQQRFSVHYWYEQPVEGLGLPLDDIIEIGADEWRRFDNALADIERMFGGGKAPDQTLGLPLAGEIERHAERERQRAEEQRAAVAAAEAAAAKHRVERLRGEAIERLGEDEGRIWLESRSDGAAATIGDIASESEEAFAQAWRALRDLVRQREKAAARERDANLRRQELTKAAQAVYGPEEARLFLTGFNRHLNARPIEYCVDSVTLTACLSLLPTGRRGSGILRQR